MAVISGEILIKTAIEAAIYDLRQNEYILEDIFVGLATDPLSKAEYGWKFVEQAVAWFKETDIPVFDQFRVGDNPVFPCITVVKANSSENLQRTNLADHGLIEQKPRIGLKLALRKVYENFTPQKYDPDTGIVTFPKSLTTKDVFPGQLLLDNTTGESYKILQCLSESEFRIETNTCANFTEACIIPKSQMMNVHREVTFKKESYIIGIHVPSQPVQNVWLSQIINYCLLGRYKEVYLDERGYEISTMEEGQVQMNENFKPEVVYTKYFTLHGDICVDWIKFTSEQLDGVKQAVWIAEAPESPTQEIKEQSIKQGWAPAADKTLESESDIDDLPMLGGDDND